MFHWIDPAAVHPPCEGALRPTGLQEPSIWDMNKRIGPSLTGLAQTEPRSILARALTPRASTSGRWAGPHPRARANDHKVEGESEWGSPSPSAPLETGT